MHSEAIYCRDLVEASLNLDPEKALESKFSNYKNNCKLEGKLLKNLFKF